MVVSFPIRFIWVTIAKKKNTEVDKSKLICMENIVIIYGK